MTLRIEFAKANTKVSKPNAMKPMPLGKLPGPGIYLLLRYHIHVLLTICPRLLSLQHKWKDRGSNPQHFRCEPCTLTTAPQRPLPQETDYSKDRKQRKLTLSILKNRHQGFEFDALVKIFWSDFTATFHTLPFSKTCL